MGHTPYCAALTPGGHARKPGQFYMLAAARAMGGGDGGRPFLPRAFSVLRAPAGGDELQFMVEDVGPGTNRLCELAAGDRLLLVGPLGVGFAPPRERRGPLLAGGGVGIAPLAILSDHLEGTASVLLGFRDANHAAGAALIPGAEIATDDGSVGHHGIVTELLVRALDLEPHAEVYACGPPAMLEAVRALCADRDVPAQLALESGMACGFGACFGCVVPTRDGFVRLCVDGPVLDADAAGARRVTDFCGIELAHPIINASGTFDAIAARRAFGDELLERFPFAAFVTKTVTVNPRQGNPPPRLWELAAGLINSIGLPNKGLTGFLANDLPELAELPVPLIVNVMGSTAEEFGRLITAFAERDEVAALELNVSCPNVRTGLDIGAEPGRDRGVDRSRPPSDEQAADRQADPERDRRARGGARRRAGGRERRLADQHGQGDGARSNDRRAVARRQDRRRLGRRDPAGRPRSGECRGGCRRDPDHRHGRCSAGPRRARFDPRRRDARGGRNGELQGPSGGRSHRGRPRRSAPKFGNSGISSDSC